MTAQNRTQVWLDVLTQAPLTGLELPASIVVAKGVLADQQSAYFIGVKPDENNPFPRARNGEVGLLEGWGLAKAVHWIIDQDADQNHKTPIIAIVDVPSQAYGRREEALGIHLALAGAVGAYAQARQLGHPVIALLVGKAMSGAFLAHGYQANQIVALDDASVMVHAMGKESAARVTMRTIDQLEALSAKVPPMAYDIENYASLGLLSGGLLQVQNIAQPSAEDSQKVLQHLTQCLEKTQQDGTDLSNRLGSKNRSATARVKELMTAQWHAE